MQVGIGGNERMDNRKVGFEQACFFGVFEWTFGFVAMHHRFPPCKQLIANLGDRRAQFELLSNLVFSPLKRRSV